VRLSGLGKRKSPRDDRLDLLPLKKFEQSDQVLAKQRRLPPFEPLDAVGDDAFAVRQQPTAGN
jgi:hypothetical protein